jgi:hypothetical protein
MAFLIAIKTKWTNQIMKKIFTLVAVLVSMVSFSFAAGPGPVSSKISITNSQRSFLQAKIDGKMYNLGNAFVLDNIRQGSHSIVIYKTDKGGFRKRTEVLYSSSMFVGNAQQLNIDINRFGKIATSQVSLLPKYGKDLGKGGRNDRDDHYRH